MKLIKTLPNGNSVRRDDANRVWLYNANGVLMGQVERGGLAAQLLALMPEDFGDVRTKESESTVSVIGPAEAPAKREPFPWYKRALNRLRFR